MGIIKYAFMWSITLHLCYKGFDPGASNGDPIGGGIDYGFYPIPTNVRVQNINFNSNKK
jgi:hypothetical protein